jgi:hypothetical protein
MNQSPRPSAPVTSSDTCYRPVSVWAVVGLAVAGSFALWLLIAAGIALNARQPLLLHPATLLLPLAAALLSVIGWRQVLHSEGTRVGLRLAQWGLTLSLLFGLGYAAYYGFGYDAVRRQAQEFTLHWFELVRHSGDSEVDKCAAFWNTIDPLRRDRTRDLNNAETRQSLAGEPAKLAALKEDLRNRYYWGTNPGTQGPFPRFFEHEVVLLLQQGGAPTSIEPLGVRSWEYLPGKEGGYSLEQMFRITTREGVFEVAVQVMSKDIDRRHWHVLLPESGVRQAQLSAFGGLIRNLNSDSRRFSGEWTGKLAEGKLENAFLDTLPPATRAELTGQNTDAVRARPDYLAFVTAGIARGPLVTDTRQILPGVEKASEALLQRAAQGNGFPLRVPPINTNPTCRWKLTATELQFFHPFDGTLAGKYRCTGVLSVATTDKTLLARLHTMAQEGPKSSEIPHTRQTSWRVHGVVMDSASMLGQQEEPK